MFGRHSCVLNIPSRSPSTYLSLPINLISLPISMPEYEVSEVPVHSRVRVPPESFLFSWPSGHVDAVELPKPFELQGIVENVFPIPVSVSLFQKDPNQM